MMMVLDAAFEIWRGFWPFLLAALLLGAVAGWLSGQPTSERREQP